MQRPTYKWPNRDFPKWARVIDVQRPVKGSKPDCLEDELAVIVNAFHSTDKFKYRREAVDFWKAPSELDVSGFGDCEDMAIYRMYYLHEHGLEDVELLIGEYTPFRMVHAVCTVKCSNTKTYTLCNMMQNVVEWGLYQSRFAPIYAASFSGVRVCG